MDTIVIGPIALRDWNTMRALRTSLNSYRQRNNPEKYAHALEVEGEIYNDYRKKYGLKTRRK